MYVFCAIDNEFEFLRLDFEGLGKGFCNVGEFAEEFFGSLVVVRYSVGECSATDDVDCIVFCGGFVHDIYSVSENWFRVCCQKF